ncbi:MAG: hypothetical protein D6740_13160 [Alphaproteobacteria bacterium]|nr:MAG: hypothetical protein D6740_13160 [Alphaproteobacteria bacterium]
MAAFVRRDRVPAEVSAYVLLLEEEREVSERAGAARGRMKRILAVILQIRCTADVPMRPGLSSREEMTADVGIPDVLEWAQAIRTTLDGWQPRTSSAPLVYRLGQLVQAERGSLMWMMTFRHDEMLAAA